MPLAKQPKLSGSQAGVEKFDSVDTGSELQIEKEPMTSPCNDESDKVFPESVAPVTPKEVVVVCDSDNEDTSSLSKAISEEIPVSEQEINSNKRIRSKSLGEAIVDCKLLKDEPLKPVRISERLSIKRNRLGDAEDGDASPVAKKQRTPSIPGRKETKKAGSSTTAATKGGKKRKPWAQWSVQDKKLFFIYLGEFGKNFEAISKKISSVAKMKGFPEKDKTQVRYFYYRCWAKVSKFIRMMDQNGGVKTVTQELYGLINYGVLRTRVKETDPQFDQCLNELIHVGETTYCSKSGKNKRFGKIKTPLCSYLKKLNKIEEKRLSSSSLTNKLPAQVTIELTPKTSAAWTKVQELSHNPRVRFKLSTNRTLESVFKYLNGKWKSQRVRLKESLASDSLPEVTSEELVIRLHPSCKVTPFTMKPTQSKKMDVAFRNYVKNILPTVLKLRKSKTNPKEVEGVEGGGGGPLMKDNPLGAENIVVTDDGVKVNDEETSEMYEVVVETVNKKDELVKTEDGIVIIEDETVKTEDGIVKIEDEVVKKEDGIVKTEDGIVKIEDETVKKEDETVKIEDETVKKEGECGLGMAICKSEMCSSPPNPFARVTSCRDSPLCILKSEPSDEETTDCVPSNPVSSPSSSLSSIASSSAKLVIKLPFVTDTQQASLINECTITTNPLSPTANTTSSSSSLPLTPPASAAAQENTTIPSPLRQLTTALNLKPVSSLSSTPPSVISSSSTDSTCQPTAISALSTYPFLPPLLHTPSPNRKKGSKPCSSKKKINFSTTNTNETCDNNAAILAPSISEDPITISPSKPAESEGDIRAEEVEGEMQRLQTLASTGFTQAYSNTVTLLHLSLLLGRASAIRLEYEWVEKQAPKSHLPPPFCSASNQLANVLRRLCNIAALELASFQPNKPSGSAKVVTCKSETAEGGATKKEGAGKKRDAVRSIGTMTDLRRTSIPANAIPLAPNRIIHHPHPGAALSHSRPTIQLNGRDSVFRVPFAPTLRPMLTKEEEQKLHLQQQQAKAIMQIPHGPRSRLLKRRSVPSRKGKPSIIVQRALLPKVSNGGPVVTYIQQPGAISSAASMLVSVGNPPVLHTTTTTTTTVAGSSTADSLRPASAGLVGSTHSTGLMTGAAVSGNNILEMAVKSAMINGSPIKQEICSDPPTIGDDSLPASLSLSASSLVTPTFSLSVKDRLSLSISDHADISISDLDLSLASASSMGPDAGDKFLDSVLERSHQGFSGLITPVSKDRPTTHTPPSVINVDTSSLSSFDDLPTLKSLHTSPVSTSSSLQRPHHRHPHPPDQSWMAGESSDVSLSSILGEFSSFHQRQPPQLKTPRKSSLPAMLFDQSSCSDSLDNPHPVHPAPIPKPPAFVTDVSLNLLLGDPNLALTCPVRQPKEEYDDDNGSGGHHHHSEKVTPLFSEASQDSLAKLDVDVTLQGMVNEASMDLVTKFETLAAHMRDQQHHDPEASRLNTPVKVEPTDQG